MSARTDAAVALLERTAPIHEKLRDLLRETVDPPADDPVGCLVVNSLVELAPRDEGIGAALARDQARRFEALHAALASAKRGGELGPAADPEALAHFVMAAISGMRVMARGGTDQAALVAVAETALTAI
jgi:hypothetical protein